MATLGRSLKSPSMLSTMAARRPAMPGRSLSNLSNTSEVSVASSSGEFSGEDIIFSAKTSPVPQQANPWPIPAKKAMDQHLKLPGMSKSTTLPIFFLLSFGHLESFFFFSYLAWSIFPLEKFFQIQGPNRHMWTRRPLLFLGSWRNHGEASRLITVLPYCRSVIGQERHYTLTGPSGAAPLFGRYTVHWVAREGGQASLQLMLPATPEKKTPILSFQGPLWFEGEGGVQHAHNSKQAPLGLA